MLYLEQLTPGCSKLPAMKYEKYSNVMSSSDFLEFEFVSSGPKGKILKLIQFQYVEEVGIYHLGFGNLLREGDFDDLSVDDNQDRNKILATVVYAVSLFGEHYSYKWIYFTGSTPARTRLYRMVISLNYNELSVDFEILGILSKIDSFVSVPFQKDVNYLGFLIRKKNA